jgi:hypothetical protein
MTAAAPPGSGNDAGQAGDVQRFTWDYRQPAPMDEIAAAVRELSGGTVRMSIPETGTDEYELVISRNRAPQAAPLWECTLCPARFAHLPHAESHVLTEHPDTAPYEAISAAQPQVVTTTGSTAQLTAGGPGVVQHVTDPAAPGQASAGQAAYEAYQRAFPGHKPASWEDVVALYPGERDAFVGIAHAVLAAREPDAAPEPNAAFTTWAETQGIDPIGMDYAEYGADALRDAFAAGMSVARQPQPAPELAALADRFAAATEDDKVDGYTPGSLYMAVRAEVLNAAAAEIRAALEGK